MTDFLQLESDAHRLRQCIRATSAAELKLLCVLRFFEHHGDVQLGQLEPYIREFIPAASAAAANSAPEEFLPEEVESLSKLQQLIDSTPADLIIEPDRSAIGSLETRARRTLSQVGRSETSQSRNRPDEVSCLFVEHYPDLGLEPRGRIIRLRVVGSPAPSDAKEDIVTVDNPVEKRDDRFLVQARQSVKAARDYLVKEKKLSSRVRFRVDFSLDSSGARFTGDSLGVAFAIAAATTISDTAVLRERLEVSPEAAFSGALSQDGQIEPIDVRGLQIKMHRAFFSRLRYLVIPREHLGEAWAYLRTLEAAHPGRKLELVGAERLVNVIEDTRLVPPVRLSIWDYSIRRVKQYGRSPWVEIPILLVALAVLVRVLLPFLDTQPAKVRLAGSGFEVLNSYSHVLWKKTFGCDSLRSNPDCWAVLDLNGDGENEVIFGPDAGRACPQSGWFFAYNRHGDSLFACDCIERYEYWGDSIKPGEPESWWGPKLDIVHIGGRLRIVSSINNIYPGRAHIKEWDSAGNQIGWYIHSGGAQFLMPFDVNGDGIEELVCEGFQNRMKGQAVFVLPSEAFHGVSPPYWKRDDDYDLSWVKRGNQLRYLFFAPTEVGRIDLHSDYQPSGVLTHPTGQAWNLSVAETKWPRGNEMIYDNIDYILSNDFRVTRVLMSDVFTKRYRHLLACDSVPQVSLSDYPDTLRNRVQYWIDSGWVTEGQLRAAGK